MDNVFPCIRLHFNIIFVPFRFPSYWTISLNENKIFTFPDVSLKKSFSFLFLLIKNIILTHWLHIVFLSFSLYPKIYVVWLNVSADDVKYESRPKWRWFRCVHMLSKDLVISQIQQVISKRLNTTATKVEKNGSVFSSLNDFHWEFIHTFPAYPHKTFARSKWNNMLCSLSHSIHLFETMLEMNVASLRGIIYGRKSDFA